MTPLYVSIAASVASILLILVVLELIRSRRLRERYALLWLATGIVLLVLSAWRGGLNTIAGWVGVTGYPPAVLFAVATLFILAVLLHYSTVISKLADQNVVLAQRLALLEQRLDYGGKDAGATRSALARDRVEDEDGGQRQRHGEGEVVFLDSRERDRPDRVPRVQPAPRGSEEAAGQAETRPSTRRLDE